MPPSVEKALAQARIPHEAVAIMVADVQEKGEVRLRWREHASVNPASIMKLVTTYAGLDVLGPAYTWKTPVYVQGIPSADGVLQGNVYIKGQGDPQLRMEELWLLMRQLRGHGVQSIHGDIILDRSAFRLPPHDAAEFDGEPLRPYNAAPDALLINFKAAVLTFAPDDGAGKAFVQLDPPMADLRVPLHVPLDKTSVCGNWKDALRADFSSASRIVLQGSYPGRCGIQRWAVALPEPEGFAAKAVQGMWESVGGELRGRVRQGTVPEGMPVAFTHTSAPLAEIIRPINKYSNNLMTQQLFLTLSRAGQQAGSPEMSRAVVQQWWREKFGGFDMPVLENGCGLSRDERVTVAGLARMLQDAWASPVMPEFIASLPVAGVDGTLRMHKGSSAGVAHLKTGSLRDAMGVAGYVLAPGGRRYVVVVIANHPNAGNMRPVFSALLDWVLQQGHRTMQ